MSDRLSLCAQEVRKNDHDQFLCSLFIPTEARQAFWALSLFQIETLRIRDAVSEPHLGLIRLQWWRDSFQSKFDQTPSPHPELGTHKELLDSLDPSRLEKDLLDRYLNARSFDMEDQPHDDVTALITYLEATLGSIAALKCQALGLKSDLNTLKAAHKIGAALGLVLYVRTLAYQGRSGRIKLPRSLIKKHDVNLKDIQDLQFTNNLGAAVKDLCEDAKKLVAEARSGQIDPKARGVFLISVSLEDYMARLAKREYNPFDPRIGGGQLTRQMKMAWRAALKRF